RTMLLTALIAIMPRALIAAEPSEESLRAADAEQKRIIVEQDAAAQAEFMHPNYIINGPMNRILRKPVLIDMLAHGKIASERFERTIEGTAITADVGIVMGSEVVKPAAGSELRERYGDKVLTRRFTNVYLFENGKWRFLARQASVIQTADN